MPHTTVSCNFGLQVVTAPKNGVTFYQKSVDAIVWHVMALKDLGQTDQMCQLLSFIDSKNLSFTVFYNWS